MASDCNRPSTRNGGSRPPTSRFQEGSMNDRTSAAPPAQFLGPDQLKDYERQFYTEAPTTNLHTQTQQQRETRKPRHNRPLSAQAQLQTLNSRPSDSDQQQQQIIEHKKSTGFFGRVRDVLNFGRATRGAPLSKDEEVVRKHSSLQEPLCPPPPPPRPSPLRAAHSEALIQKMSMPSLGDGGSSTDRPSREDVLASYNELMASGFFQSHAIQSTRHAGPAGSHHARRSAPMPSIPSVPCSPQPPPRTSSINATGPESPWGKIARRGTAAATRTSDVSMSPSRAPPPPPPQQQQPLQKKNSLYALRGRKRSRAVAEDPDEGRMSCESSSGPAPSAPTSGTASFAEPLRRVAKKLRKMPSSVGSATTAHPQTSDGVLRLPPSVSSGGTLHLDSKPLRLRSPSPAPPPDAMKTTAGAGEKARGALRRTFSGGSNRLRKRNMSPAARKASGGGGGHGPEERMLSSVNGMRGERESKGERRWGGERGDDNNGDDEIEIEVPVGAALCVVPDANRGIPSVPRIPDQYYRKPRGRHVAGRGSDENDRMDVDVDVDVHTNAEWQFGEAL